MLRRTLALTAAAFLVGALAAAAMLYEGSPLGIGAGPSPMLVRVENRGTNDATALFEVREMEGTFSTRSEMPVASGATRDLRIDRELTGDIFVKVTISYGGARPARGDIGLIVDPADCAGDERMMVTFVTRTTNGVTFETPVSKGCAGA